MSRPHAAYILVAILALMGSGVPQALHLFVDHLPPAGDEAADTAAALTAARGGCRSSCCAFHGVQQHQPSAQEQDAEAGDEPSESETPQETGGECPVCTFLAVGGALPVVFVQRPIPIGGPADAAAMPERHLVATARTPASPRAPPQVI